MSEVGLVRPRPLRSPLPLLEKGRERGPWHAAMHSIFARCRGGKNNHKKTLNNCLNGEAHPKDPAADKAPPPPSSYDMRNGMLFEASLARSTVQREGR